MQFPHRLLLTEYADALNRGDRGWLEYLFDPGVHVAVDGGVSGRSAVADQLAHGSTPRVRCVGEWNDEPVVVVWGSDGQPVSIERIESGPNGIVSVGISQVVDPLHEHLHAAPPAHRTKAPIPNAPRVAFKTLRAQIAIGLHQTGPYFDCVVDPCFEAVERWLAMHDLAPSGPYSALFDDVSRHRDGQAPFTVVVPIEGSLSELPRAARGLAVVHPWVAPNSWRGPRAEISVLAMPMTTVACVTRPAWVSTGEFMRTLNAARRAVMLEGRTAGWPIREIYHDTGAEPLAHDGCEADWEIHIPVI